MSWMDVMYGGLGQVNNQFQANLGQNAAAMGQQQNFYSGLSNLGAQNQQAYAAAGPTPYGYGFVGGYPSFGEAGNYGGNNDPFSGGGGGGSKYTPFPAADPMNGDAYGGAGGGGTPMYDPWTGAFSGYAPVYSEAPQQTFADAYFQRAGGNPFNMPRPAEQWSGLSQDDWFSAATGQPFNSGGGYSGGGIGSDARYGGQNIAGPAGSASWWPTFLANVGPEAAQQWMIDNGHSNAGGGGNDTRNQFGQSYAPPAAQTPFPAADPMNSGGYGGGGGGGGWDSSNQWGQPYAPPGGGGGGLAGPAGSEGWWSTFVNTMGVDAAKNWLTANGHPSSAGGGASSTSNMYGQPWAPKDQGYPPYQMWSEPQPDPYGNMWGGRYAITNALMQQGMQYPGAGGFSDMSGFNSPMSQYSPGGYMTTGQAGMGVDGFGFGGAQVQGQQPAAWADPFGSSRQSGGG